MRFFKKRKKSSETSGLFSIPDISTIMNEEEENAARAMIEEAKVNKIIFDQAAEIYTKAQNILKDRQPTGLDENAGKEYFNALISAYKKLLSCAHCKEIYTTFRFCRLFLNLHRDLAVCYAEGIGVQPDDFERRRHMAGVGFLFEFYIYLETELGPDWSL